MRERIDASIAAVEATQQDGAGLQPIEPLMETLGGFAIAAGLMYGGIAWSRPAPRPASSFRS